MDIKDLKGVIPPIVTPVDENENVDEQGLMKVIDHVLAGGVHGVFVMGSNGEFYAMDEWKSLSDMLMVEFRFMLV